MSDTKLKLTEKQREWANAFLRAMGEESQIGVDEIEVAPEKRSFFKKKPETGLKGELVQFDGTLDQISKERLNAARNEIIGLGEKITRPRGSLDLGYRKNVAGDVDQVLQEADRLIKEGKFGPSIGDLVDRLQVQYEHYAGRVDGEQDSNKITQRRAKMAAIKLRQNALLRLKDQLADVDNDRVRKAQEMEAHIKGKVLIDNPEILDGILAKKPTAPNLADFLSGINFGKDGNGTIVDKIVDKFKGDPEYLNILTSLLLFNGTAKEKSSTFFRGDSFANRMANRSIAVDDSCKDYLAAPVQSRNAMLVQISESVKNQGGKTGQDDEKGQDKNRDPVEECLPYDQIIANSVQEAVNTFVNTEVPERLLRTLMTFAAAGSTVEGVDHVGQIGSQVSLKYFMNQVKAAPKKVKNKEVPLNKLETAVTTLYSAALQSIFNNVQPKGNLLKFQQVLVVIENTTPIVRQWAENIWNSHKGDFGL
jgi:hypothetical protein